jgi:putative hydrolase of the HAD superfamily
MSREVAWHSIGGIVFDAVGTLIEPHPPVAEVYAEAARQQNVIVDSGEVRARFLRYLRHDEAIESKGALSTDEANERERWRRIVANVLPEVPDPPSAFETLWEHFGRPLAWRCFPDVGEVLEALHTAQFPMGIASNFDARLRRVAAGLPQLAGPIESFVISSEVGYRKPHPRFFEAVCAVLCLPPARILCVGDDLDNDVMGAARAGLLGVWLDRRGSRAGEGVPRIPALTALMRLVRS